uniref:PH domain-containing protein n=1 Tax=Ningiella ruwaisensis TaxID=2364274 RepID=UPI00109F3E39|nr:PH domain-containing protein [Ningiella ruwaisensis]
MSTIDDAPSSDFSNQNISIEDVSVDNLTLSAISPRYRKINIGITLGVSLFICAIVLILDLDIFMTMPEVFSKASVFVYAIVLPIGVLSALYHFFADPLIKYAVREQDVHLQSGLFFRTIVSQPILRIQHIELKRGPIERKAGLASLQVFSAGGISHTFEIPGLEYEKAVSLRKFIIDHKDLSLDE